ncbi:hypothetical protein RhiLY_04037 [Ceratobasidium sp. AG-Ba]|nr:hypothetical protein RhiLY_04037 [Ceratobasidium sp. AG-Ba]
MVVCVDKSKKLASVIGRVLKLGTRNVILTKLPERVIGIRGILKPWDSTQLEQQHYQWGKTYMHDTPSIWPDYVNRLTCFFDVALLVCVAVFAYAEGLGSRHHRSTGKVDSSAPIRFEPVFVRVFEIGCGRHCRSGSPRAAVVPVSPSVRTTIRASWMGPGLHRLPVLLSGRAACASWPEQGRQTQTGGTGIATVRAAATTVAGCAGGVIIDSIYRGIWGGGKQRLTFAKQPEL